MQVPDIGTAVTHAIYGTLRKEGLIEAYDVFQNKCFPIIGSDSITSTDRNDSQIAVAAVLKLGSALDRHDGIIHGSILALLIDDVLGFGFEVL
jgi:hypothetical protein